MAAVSLALGLVGCGCLGLLMALDTAGVAHGRSADVALVLGWLTAGGLAVALGLAARRTALGRIGLALGLLALPLGLVAFGILALVLTT